MRKPGARALAVALTAGALLLPAVLRAEETVLFFERQSQTVAHRSAEQGGSALVDTSRTEIAVTIGERRVVVYETSNAWIYDFERRRVKSVDSSRHTYSDWSMYSFVAFAEAEMRSRLELRGRMMAGRRGPGPSVLDLESLFSMRAGARIGPGESLVDSSKGSHLRFFVNRALAVDAELSDTAFAPGRAASFERFLAFQAHLHPVARKALAATGKVPRVLFYRYRDYNDETMVILRLKRISSAPDDNEPTATARQVETNDPAYAEFDRRVAACRACSSQAGWLEESRRFEAAALDSGRTLDAALARAERVIGACEADTAWPAALAAGERDTALAAVRAGLAWRDSAGAIAAADRLDHVNGARLAKGYVLDLLRGRARLYARQLEAGSYMMMGGLGGNPCMAGAWLDMAHGYLDAYQPVLAWICFEAAERTLSPGCEVRLEERARLEAGIARRHPEFFQ